MYAPPSAVREACDHIISVDGRSHPHPSPLDVGRMTVVVPDLSASAFVIRDGGKVGTGKVMDMLIDSVRLTLPEVIWPDVSKKRKASSGLSIFADDTSTSGVASAAANDLSQECEGETSHQNSQKAKSA
ncbi:hypothetical protein N7454_005530 [Penicillium verhagenii]|nr:hypothetical protein N7454_005530 [Penicillium verhagenii]